MNHSARLACLLASSALLASCLSAQVFLGSDNFNDGVTPFQSFDPNPGPQLPGQWRFSSPNNPGTGGAWTEVNGRMEYTTTAATGFNRGQLGWSSPSASITAEGAAGLSNGTPYASNWVAQVTVTNTTLALSGSAYTGTGIEIYTLGTGNSNNGYYGLALTQNAQWGTRLVSEWGTWNSGNNSFTPGFDVDEGAAFTGVTSAILRMSYDGTSKALEFSYSLDAGATFLVATTLDLDGANAGPEAPLNGGIGLRLFAYTNSGAGAITSAQMTFDNFSVTTTAIPEPSTYAALVGLAALGLAGWNRRRRLA